MDDKQLLATMNPTIFFEVVDTYLSSAYAFKTGRFGISFGTLDEAGSTRLVSTLSVDTRDINTVLLLSKLCTSTRGAASRLGTKVPPSTSLSSRQRGRKEPYPYRRETITILHKDEDCKVVGIAVGEEKPAWGTVPLGGADEQTPAGNDRLRRTIDAHEQRWDPDFLANNIVALVEPGAMHCYLWVLEALGYRGDLYIRGRPLNLITSDQKVSSFLLLSVPVQRECGLCLESELCLAAPFVGHLPEEFTAGDVEIARLPYALAKRIAASDEWEAEVSIIIGSDNGAFCRIELENEIIQKSVTGMASFAGTPPLHPIREDAPDSRARPVAVTMPGSLCSGEPLPGSQRADYVGMIVDSIADNCPTEDDELKWDWRDFFFYLGTDPVVSLISQLSSDDIVTRWKAAWALGDIGDPRAVEPLITAFLAETEGPYWHECPHYDLKMVIAYVLGKFKDPRAVDALIEEIHREPDDEEDCHSEIVAAAAWALGEIGDTRAIPALETALTTYEYMDEDPGFVNETLAEKVVLSEIYQVVHQESVVEDALMKLEDALEYE